MPFHSFPWSRAMAGPGAPRRPPDWIGDHGVIAFAIDTKGTGEFFQALREEALPRNFEQFDKASEFLYRMINASTPRQMRSINCAGLPIHQLALGAMRGARSEVSVAFLPRPV